MRRLWKVAEAAKATAGRQGTACLGVTVRSQPEPRAADARGSITSRSPSPRTLKVRTVSGMAMAGKVENHKPQERVLQAGAPKPLRARDLTYWERIGQHEP